VTLSAEAAEDPRFVHELVGAGMDCARINCARDDAEAWNAMAEHVRTAERVHERACRILVDLGGSKPRTGAVAGGAKRLRLAVGDEFELVAQDDGLPVRDQARPRIACEPPAILAQVQPGQTIWFDDGKIGGRVVERTADGVLIRVTDAKPGGGKLRPDRGINLPDTADCGQTFTEKDRDDLEQVVAWADVVELSFVQRREEVLALHEELCRHDADHIGVVLKIETRRAFDELPQLLFAAMQRRSCGVMIARGDLAVEIGFERMAEVQEEILWLAEAAHVPTIWATQVLDDLAKKDTLSRAEMSDAAMSARAEAVLLSKGPFVIDAIDTLDDILGRMKEHQSKKRSLLRALRVSGRAWH
jgi:pyruvate kinase